ncbi:MULTISPECIES: hypothetical protein [Clostridium]|jgi:hypothetical protein|uniref:Uncharacterized protein n=4 Tax=Clostridium TaxID=1485 RepID=A0A1S8QER7_CLOBE|nr:MULTISPECIES: hypothetical protein [Clostridium]ALB47108.1 hypothetical protein X276_18600 [Clostridium beijerinckii NRRL B-598]AQS04305.1 hypothetical protein CLBIJ_17240 [Clostridium beijerinckii]AVK50621.1 hypothetical protein AXY43_22845 [Clostridium sp. MF28]MBA2883802.1 hypothetical protein [Clostridium beijerinckii]MBA2898988.1 hypothetical protein [Clostridium beijerinckii]
MKIYTKNKDFIPERFFNKAEMNTIRKENKVIILFLIINLIAFPFVVQNISETKESSKLNRNSNLEEGKIKFEDISIWVKNLMKDNIEEAHITNNGGDIIVNNLSDIDELSSNGFIEIHDMNLNDNEKYKLGVSLYE